MVITMTAIVKHISVHPKFRYASRVGIFDELDKREAESRPKTGRASRHYYKQVGFSYNYADKTSKVIEPLRSPFTPSPEK